MTQEATKPQESHPAPPPRKPIPKRRFIIIGVLVALILFVIIRNLPPPPSNKLLVSGRVEGYETNVGAKVGGRVDFIAYREGHPVRKGELIVKLNDEDLQAQLRGAEARIVRAIAQRNSAAQQLNVAQAQINEANLNVAQSREDMQGRINQAEANVAQAQAQLHDAESQLAQAKAQLELTRIRKRRFDYLVAEGAVSTDEADQANTNYRTALDLVRSKESSVLAARKQALAQQGLLTQATTSRFNPPIKTAQLNVAEQQLVQAQEQLAAANQDIKDATAARDQILANIGYLTITSPINGVVTARTVEPGAVVAAGQTVLSLLDYDTVYLRAYVPEGDIGKVRLGQEANIYLDSAPKTALPGEVIEIDPEASFTPENIYFREDRVKQVFGIRIAFKNPKGYAKPGMPADADIFYKRK